MGFFTAQLTEDGTGTVTFLDSYGDLRTVTTDESPEGFPRLVAALSALQPNEDLTPEQVWEYVRPLQSRVTKLDDRVSFNEETGILTFDGEPIHDHLAQTIIRYFREGRSTKGLVAFLENLAANPSRRSREQLFNWTERQSLTITDDGHFIGYKGVRDDGKSVHSGLGYVNGVKMEGRIPNEVGSVISVPRDYVQDDPNVGCSHGLHVGSYSYGSTFGNRLLEVKVNPTDVVSVPVECQHQKLRCCRYEVLAIHEAEVDDIADTYEPKAGEDPYDWWDDDDDFDYDEHFEGPLVDKAVPTRILDRFRKALGLGGRKADDGDE